jgi:hypothetical protein
MDRTQRKAVLIAVGIVVVGLAAIAGFFAYSVANMGAIMAELPEEPEFDRRSDLEDKTRLLDARTDEYDRWVELPPVALLEARIGDPARAKAHVDEILVLAPKYVSDWNYGNATHKAHLALGHIALRAGDLPTARKELLTAGDTRGSPQLDTFGPNMTLAKYLLAKGERETVLAYIAKLRGFWKMDGGAIDKWTEMIREGRTPNFGAHLLY